MKKFLLLFTKEIKELLTPQMLIPFLAVIVVFLIIGNFGAKQVQKQTKAKENIIVWNADQSNLSLASEKIVGEIANVQEVSATNESDFLEKLKVSGTAVGLIIPKGFEQNVLETRKANLKTYGIINSFHVLATKKFAVLDASVKAINEFISNNLINSTTGTQSAQELKNPITTTSYVEAKNKLSIGNPAQVLTFITSQASYMPAVLFVVIIFAAQMIAAAVATEKENKTLETLLSLPISRKAIVASKMLAAGVISLVMAGIYMFGIRSFTNGLTASMQPPTAAVGEGANQIAQNLGLTFTTMGYVELGVILFLEILLALAIAMILGAFSEDAKGAAGVVAPLMILVMIPYFVILFLDINALSAPIRYLIYAIPFSHIFMASSNIFLGNNLFILYGAIYLLILFVIFVLIAAKIFSSDLILTLKLSFSKKKK